jgi:hypothetical protein
MRTEIYIDGNALDLTKNISAEFTYAIDEIQDFATRNTSFSKTIILPGNDNNNKLFGNIFEFGLSNQYNPAEPNVGYNKSLKEYCVCLKSLLMARVLNMRWQSLVNLVGL